MNFFYIAIGILKTWGGSSQFDWGGGAEGGWGGLKRKDEFIC